MKKHRWNSSKRKCKYCPNRRMGFGFLTCIKCWQKKFGWK